MKRPQAHIDQIIYACILPQACAGQVRSPFESLPHVGRPRRRKRAISMKRQRAPSARQYRLWIGRVGHWRPRCWQDLPPRFVALEPADDSCYSAKHALAFLEGFNRQMLATRGRHWAVALAIEIRSGGDFAPPRLFSGHQLRRDGPMRALHRRHGVSTRAVQHDEITAGTGGPRPTLHFVRAIQTAK